MKNLRTSACHIALAATIALTFSASEAMALPSWLSGSDEKPAEAAQAPAKPAPAAKPVSKKATVKPAAKKVEKKIVKRKVKAACSTSAYEAAMDVMHKNMHTKLTGNPDIDFVRGMIPHHQGAVDMAKIQLKFGHDEKLKTLSQRIITSQEQEIAFMKQWLVRHDNSTVTFGSTDYYGEAMTKMHHAMHVKYTGDADMDFVNGMIPHHQGAVDMARILSKTGLDPELNKLADNIYSTQTQEIGWMQRWLEKHGK